MTVNDMITLAEMWIYLAEPMPGNMVQQITLPGNMTGRAADRNFACRALGSIPRWDKEEPWLDHLKAAVEHVDFVEITACSLDSLEKQEAEKTP